MSDVRRFTAQPEDQGVRLDVVLARRVPGLTRTALAALVRAGKVSVSGVTVAKPSRPLRRGEEVSVEIAPPEPSRFEPEAIPLSVLHEDADLLVLDKPAGLVVHPAAGRRRGTLVNALLGRALPLAPSTDPSKPGIVHRLDRDTSGLLVVARSDEAHRRLQRLLRRRELEREYLALVRGRPRSRSGRVEAAIGRDRTDPTRISLDTATPREAVTNFEVVELLPHHALLRVRLETGRTHQIRVHLAAIDLPVAGDPVYGVAGDLGLERQFLHSARLAFAHPFRDERVEVESPLPPDLEAALERAAEP
jgi:23S rRNA pseudouridine1911/1915/1917 synthase